MKFWNLVSAGGERVLRLVGPIAEESWIGDEVTPSQFEEELYSGRGNITVWLNSPGGCVFAAAAIYTMLKEYPGKVTVKIDALAASAASVIAMAGDEVLMSPTAYIIIHNPETIAAGDSVVMMQAKGMLDEVKESIISAYELKTGLPRIELSRMMNENRCMNARTAVDLGFADGILYTDSAVVDDMSPMMFSQSSVSNAIIAKIQSQTQYTDLKKGGGSMPTSMQLREVRKQKWEAAKAFYDSKVGDDGLIAPEDMAVYNRMEAEVTTLKEQIDMLERREAVDRDLSALTIPPILSPVGGNTRFR